MSALPPILDWMNHHGMKIFTHGEFNLNIFGIRMHPGKVNEFDDLLGVAYREMGSWVVRYWPITTDPGLYWLENPMNVDGTAILVPGQYRGAWTLGRHRGRYDALVQRKPVKVYRDRDGDGFINTDADSIQKGMFGINIHRAKQGASSSAVNKWSAGCQVFARAADFDEFMFLVGQSAPLYGSTFTYTLLESFGGVIGSLHDSP